MATIFRIKRRIGTTGAPTGLKGSELAYNELDNILYYGQGISTGDNAAAVIPIGGSGHTVTIAGTQTISGNKTFSGTVDVPTVAAGNNSTNAASTSWVRTYAQPLATGLTALATLATFGFPVQTSAGVYAVRSITVTARLAITNGDGVATNPSIDLATLADDGTGTFVKISRDVYGRVAGSVAVVATDITGALTFTPENAVNKGNANGYASLDGTGKVPSSQLPASVAGGLNYQGVWNASTNTPTLVNATGIKGYYYKVSVAGNTTIDGNTNWTVGDMIAYNGTTWDKMEGGTSDVVSVAGKTGAITLNNTDISGLGTLSTQNSNAVNITGGTVAGSTISGNIAGNAVNITGIAVVANGGTGVATLTGYVKGNGTAVMTGSATIPSTDITGLGTMSTQAASGVVITGGTIDGIVLDGGTF